VHKVRAKDVSLTCFIPELEVIFNMISLAHLIAHGGSISITSCHCVFMFWPRGTGVVYFHVLLYSCDYLFPFPVIPF